MAEFLEKNIILPCRELKRKTCLDDFQNGSPCGDLPQCVCLWFVKKLQYDFVQQVFMHLVSHEVFHGPIDGHHNQQTRKQSPQSFEEDLWNLEDISWTWRTTSSFETLFLGEGKGVSVIQYIRLKFKTQIYVRPYFGANWHRTSTFSHRNCGNSRWPDQQAAPLNRNHHVCFLKCFQRKPIEKPHHEGSQSVIYNPSFSGIKSSKIYIHNILIQHRIYNLWYRVCITLYILMSFWQRSNTSPSFTVTKA